MKNFKVYTKKFDRKKCENYFKILKEVKTHEDFIAKGDNLATQEMKKSKSKKRKKKRSKSKKKSVNSDLILQKRVELDKIY